MPAAKAPAPVEPAAEESPAPQPPPGNVIAAIAAIMRDMPGIGRTERSDQGYSYRGIEAITAELQRLMGRYGVVFVPEVIRREVREFPINNRPWTEDHLTVVYRVYGPGGVDDMILVGPIQSLGRDNSDKGINKCQPAGTMVRVPTGGSRGGHADARYGYAEVPIESLLPGDRIVTWKRHGSTLLGGGRPLQGIAVRDYAGPLVTVQAGSRTSRFTPDHRCFVKLGMLAEGDHVVYLMRRGSQYRIGRSSWGGTPGSRRGGLVDRIMAQHADAAWLLSVHHSADEAALSEALLAHEFNIPETLFCGVGHRDHRMDLDQFWAKVGDNTEEAAACLRSCGLLIDAPLMTRPRRTGDSWLSHDGVAAANLRSGMLVPAPYDPPPAYQGVGIRYPVAWEPVTVGRDYHSGPVYSLDVAVEHNYIADGLVSPNCMTQAYKYALLQVFAIGDAKDDADRDQARQADAPMDPDDWAKANGWTGIADLEGAKHGAKSALADLVDQQLITRERAAELFRDYQRPDGPDKGPRPRTEPEHIEWWECHVEPRPESLLPQALEAIMAAEAPEGPPEAASAPVAPEMPRGPSDPF